MATSKDGIILKLRSVNCPSIIRPIKQLSKVSAVPTSRILLKVVMRSTLNKEIIIIHCESLVA